MSVLEKRKNGRTSLFPSLRNDLFSNRFFSPSLLENDILNINTPLANVMETNKEFKLDLSVPGLKKEDFKIDIDNGFLTISSEKEEEEVKDEDENYDRQEFSYSSFSRTFELPDNVDENNINAKYENGMLKINIPKKEVSISKSKSIKVL